MLSVQKEDMGRLDAHSDPTVIGFSVAGSVFVTGKAGEIELVLVDAEPFLARQKLKAPCNRFFLEIVAERPVSEHFKEREVRRIADLVYVAGSDAFLNVRQSRARGVLFTHQVRHERMHPCRREQNGRIVLGNQRCGRYDRMSLFAEKAQIHFAQIVSAYLFHSYL